MTVPKLDLVDAFLKALESGIDASRLADGSVSSTVFQFLAGITSSIQDQLNVKSAAIHNLVDTTNHPVAGLTAGQFLKALSATAYGFAAHGLTYSDVGAAAVDHTHSGSGTTARTLERTGIAVAASGSTTVAITSQGNRGLAHYLKVTETGGLMTGTYDVLFYADSSYSTLLYQSAGVAIAAAYEDWEPWWLEDSGSNSTIYLKIINNDSSHAGTFTVDLKYEQFA